MFDLHQQQRLVLRSRFIRSVQTQQIHNLRYVWDFLGEMAGTGTGTTAGAAGTAGTVGVTDDAPMNGLGIWQVLARRRWCGWWRY
jgi:hypothetical protein